MRKDHEFLQFIHDRMVNVHGENDCYDYMWRLRAIIDNLKNSQTVSLNKIVHPASYEKTSC